MQVKAFDKVQHPVIKQTNKKALSKLAIEKNLL
jgi:hypothetical protein